ncbi:MAG TPA: caspase family protein [Thermoleophilaceae bacterium]|nr:caspase family protein [Thermoleophilaceae bacterium]
MPKGKSINIGLNHVDPDHYEGWDGALVACEFDAEDMNKLASAAGLDAQAILASDATADGVSAAIAEAAEQLDSGDLLFLTYSGHGGQMPDPDNEESDHRDETWVLYDRQLLDDELFALWSKFKPGVRILVLSDSCHSGSVTRAGQDRYSEIRKEEQRATKEMPADVQAKTFRAHRDEYAAIKRSHPEGDDVEVGATVQLISGCKDDQLSLDGVSNGLFTENLLAVWDEGRFEGDYSGFHEAILARMPDEQTPQRTVVGSPSTDFEKERPLTV